jgi:hypothetical protein
MKQSQIVPRCLLQAALKRARSTLTLGLLRLEVTEKTANTDPLAGESVWETYVVEL